MKKIQIYDTTLRDGNQARNISLSVEDKLLIAKQLNDLGIDYIEGGWPNATNPTDQAFFKRVREERLDSMVTAFGSTRRPGVMAADDPIIQELVNAETKGVTIFGKSWDLHVLEVIKTELAENIAMIEESVSYLRGYCDEVIYDAEHFFDGYLANPEHALDTLRAAERGGASVLVLCDTNGGVRTSEIIRIIEEVRRAVNMPLGIHTHNDSGMAVASSVAAVEHGCVHVQGTINGFGERCGNADLVAIIPSLELKLKHRALPEGRLRSLKAASLYVNEVANVVPDERQPYVGEAAFSHKGGAHIDGVLKVSRSFEHIDPAAVGNQRRYVLSDQAGGAAIVEKIKRFLPGIDKKDPIVKTMLNKVKTLEHDGYRFEGADASLELMLKRELKQYEEPFHIFGYRVIEDKAPQGEVSSEATIKLEAEQDIFHTAANGHGPVDALSNALRKALANYFPQIDEVHLVDYKVRVLSGQDGTAAKVHVHIQSCDGHEEWGTTGVSENIIEASWIALLDSLNYKLMKTMTADR